MEEVRKCDSGLLVNVGSRRKVDLFCLYVRYWYSLVTFYYMKFTRKDRDMDVLKCNNHDRNASKVSSLVASGRYIDFILFGTNILRNAFRLSIDILNETFR